MRNIYLIVTGILSSAAALIYSKGVSHNFNIMLSIGFFQTVAGLGLLVSLLNKQRFKKNLIKSDFKKQTIILLIVFTLLNIIQFYTLLKIVNQGESFAVFIIVFSIAIDLTSILVQNKVFKDSAENKSFFWIGLFITCFASILLKIDSKSLFFKGFTLELIITLILFIITSLMSTVIRRIATTKNEVKLDALRRIDIGKIEISVFNVIVFLLEGSVGIIYFLLFIDNLAVSLLDVRSIISLIIIGLLTFSFMNISSKTINDNGMAYVSAILNFRIIPLYFLVYPILSFCFDNGKVFEYQLKEIILIWGIVLGASIAYFKGKPKKFNLKKINHE